MSAHLTKNTGKPYFVFDDFFTQDDVNAAISEFDLTIRPLMRRDRQDGATIDNKLIKNTNSCFINHVYSNPYASACFKITRKYYAQDFQKYLSMNHWLFGAMQQHELQEDIQFIYYENNDNYGDHFDSSLFTFLWWLAPDKINGGDLILDGFEKVDFRHNRVVVFPLQMKHGVIPVDCLNKGRYCVSNFVNLSLT